MSEPSAEEAIIRADGVKKLYRLGDEEVWALKGVSLSIARAEFVSIMGPSGSGKSTLFNQLGALDRPTEGRVYFDGQSVFELSESQQAWFRCHKVGYIFQTFNLIPVMSALQNVALPLILAGESEVAAKRRAQEILERVGLGHRLEHKPFELSGGQQQRVAVARALGNRPAVVLADEPTGNLDTKTGSEIVALLAELNEADDVTIVCSTHDPKVLARSSRVFWIEDGRLVKETTREQFRLDEMAADRLGRS
ncbi:MAG: ABC transporter ATP-binding protein [Myxococcota bacterium]